MSLLAGLSYPKKLGGIVAISGWLAIRKGMDARIHEANKSTPVLYCYGSKDPVVDVSLTKAWSTPGLVNI